jgi:hypothetical protein
LSSQECKNSPAEYCCLVPFSLFPFFFSSTWRGDRSDSVIDAAVQFNPSMPLLFSPCMHVESTQLCPACDRHLLTTWPDLQCTTAQRLSSSSTFVPSTDASSSFWLLHMALCTPCPLLRSLRHVQRPRSVCELACSDQRPTSWV